MTNLVNGILELANKLVSTLEKDFPRCLPTRYTQTLCDVSMSKSVRNHTNRYSHSGSINLGIIGFTNRHLSLAERATILERNPAVPPPPSSVGRGVYSVDDAMKGSSSSSSSSGLGTEDGCGRRKKYARGIVSGRTYETVVIRKDQRRIGEFLLMIAPRLLAHQGFEAPTKGMRRRAQQHPFQMQNIWVRRKRSDQV